MTVNTDAHLMFFAWYKKLYSAYLRITVMTVVQRAWLLGPATYPGAFQ